MRIGLAQIDITPPLGLPLMGNFRDDYAARGAHDPLMAKAAVFEDAAGRMAAVLALDLCMVDRENVALVRRKIGRTCRVPPENVLVHATHTHSGPATMDRFLFGVDFEPHKPAVEAMLAMAAAAVAEAERDLAPAGLSIGYADEDRISFNRRLRHRDGSTQMNWESLQPGFDPDAIEGAWGPIDPQVTCLVVEREGRPAGAIVNFALHPAILAGDNWLYSADYPGYLAAAIEREMRRREEGASGTRFVSLFLGGCAGDVNHIDLRDPLQGRGFTLAERVGHALATAALEAMRRREPVADGPVGASRKMVPLERLRIPPDERARCRQVLKEAEARPPQGQVDGLPEAFFAGLRVTMAAVEDQPDAAEVQVLSLGEVAVVGLPGEPFCELGLWLKGRSPSRHTLVAGLANDAIGYLPTRDAFAQGGYETETGSTFYLPGTGERLAEAVVQTLQDNFKPI